MRDDDPQSGPSNTTRRAFLLTTGSTAAATIIGACAPALANSPAGQSGSAVASADGQQQSLGLAHRRSRTALPGRAARPQQVRTGRTSKARSPSRCALTARTTNFASTPGRRCWIACVRPLLLPERKRAVTTGSAVHAQCM